MSWPRCCFFFFFFNDTATTEIYTLSLHDALPIWCTDRQDHRYGAWEMSGSGARRSEEHTSELQSPCNLVCRLLLEKKQKNNTERRLTTRAPDRPPVTELATLI